MSLFNGKLADTLLTLHFYPTPATVFFAGLVCVVRSGFGRADADDFYAAATTPITDNPHVIQTLWDFLSAKN